MTEKDTKTTYRGVSIVIVAVGLLALIVWHWPDHPKVTSDVGVASFITAKALSKAERENEAFVLCTLQDSVITVLGKIEAIHVTSPKAAYIVLKGHGRFFDDNHDLCVRIAPELICEIGKLRKNQWIMVKGLLAYNHMAFHMDFQLNDSQIIHVFSREDKLRTFD